MDISAVLAHVLRCHAIPCLQMDRPALSGFEIVEELEKEFGLQSYPVTWCVFVLLCPTTLITVV